MRKTWVAALAASISLFGANVQAQGATDGRLPIDLSSDTSEASDPDKVVVYRGKVEVFQGDNRLRADVVTAHFDTKPNGDWGEVASLEASGNVFFVTPNEVVRGDRAEYSFKDDTLVVSGDVIVRRGDNVISGGRLVIEIGAGRSAMSGPSGTGARPRGVFYPKAQEPPSARTP